MMQTKFGLSRNPEAYEAIALEYEKKGNIAKAQKNRDKAIRLRQAQLNNPSGTSSSLPNPLAQLRSPERYDQKALKWQNKGNGIKAQKNRDKAAKLRAEQATSYNPAIARSTSGTALGQTTYNPPLVETHTRPVIVEQTVRPEKIVEVQPVVHREVDAPQVRVIEKHVYETAPPVGPSTVTRTPIVEEVVRPRVIEEIQPIVHREVPVPFVQRVEEHITEHVTKPAIVTKEVQTQGVSAGGLPAKRL